MFITSVQNATDRYDFLNQFIQFCILIRNSLHFAKSMAPLRKSDPLGIISTNLPTSCFAPLISHFACLAAVYSLVFVDICNRYINEYEMI